jgi:hypothetical protein
MIVFPKEMPVVEKLNSYFLNIPRFIEHYQGEIGTGCAAMKSVGAEAAVFFNKDDLVSIILDRQENGSGRLITMDEIVNIARGENFSVNLYGIEEAFIDYWANLPDAAVIYKNLSTDFTNLEKLIAKMQAERLTGYIDVTLSGDNGRGQIFFCGGKCLGAAHSWENWRLNTAGNLWYTLMSKASDIGAIFNVLRIPLERAVESGQPSADTGGNGRQRNLEMLAALLSALETEVGAESRIRGDFQVLLKKKFVEKAETYPFLDPFAAEFEYRDHRIDCPPEIRDGELLTGVTEAVHELSVELGIHSGLQKALSPWREKYADIIRRFRVQV